MIEIIALYNLCKHIGKAARKKGRRAIGYQLMLLLFWFSGQFGTALLSGIVLFLAFGEEAEGYLVFVYLAAIVGGIVGAWLAFTLVAGLPDLLGMEETAPE